MKIKALLLASTVALLAATGAKAADAIIQEEPAPVILPAGFSWEGAYIGGQIGYGWGKSEFSDGVDYLKIKPDGFLGGVYGGYNFDLGNDVILGIDADVTYNDLEDSYSEIIDGDRSTLESKLRWSGAVRGRVGYAFDRFLPYIAGGVAFGGVKNSVSIAGLGGVSESKTHTGWTIGGGFDYAATDNVILRLEYRYTDYGKKDYDFGTDYSVENKFKTHDVRLGVAYKF
ncbi:porin family protein [Falsochrobactrum shanghaiense]|uniref:Porin family protein n=1 Tax=Falsochrobactrum shanghaiense TaxID=2201899 RepID=A0A316JD04_9HYPH|nr:outer membrane protein [Falsochrobactrum shanghaiense]PWL19354.1 porin family protein [Falsochrobactrum shanghaiense]